MLREYNDVLPGAAERVLNAFERQSIHRQDMEKAVVAGNIKAQRRGAWLGFLIALAVLGVAAYLANIGHPGVAGIVVSVDLVALASVFIYGKIDQRQERQDKFRLMQGGS